MTVIQEQTAAWQQKLQDEFDEFVVKFLPREGIDESTVSYRARCVLECAECVEAADHNGRTLLHWAAIDGDIEAIKFFVSHGADVNEKCGLGNTPLHWVTCLWNDSDNCLIDFLVSVGSRVNTKNKDGHTPLHLAAFYGRLKSAELLISIGAKINAKSRSGHTPLHLAVYHVDVLQFLIDSGADINARSHNGSTPLHEAVWVSSLEAVKILVAAGADTETENEYDATPFELAESNGQAEIAGFLLELS